MRDVERVWYVQSPSVTNRGLKYVLTINSLPDSCSQFLFPDSYINITPLRFPANKQWESHNGFFFSNFSTGQLQTQRYVFGTNLLSMDKEPCKQLNSHFLALKFLKVSYFRHIVMEQTSLENDIILLQSSLRFSDISLWTETRTLICRISLKDNKLSSILLFLSAVLNKGV